MNVLLIGDIVGHPGRTITARTATRWKADHRADLVIATIIPARTSPLPPLASP